jgi:hypothetical protein
MNKFFTQVVSNGQVGYEVGFASREEAQRAVSAWALRGVHSEIRVVSEDGTVLWSSAYDVPNCWKF